MASSETDESLRERAAAVVLPLSIVIGLVIASVIAVSFMTGHLPFRSFDSVKWKQVERSDDHSRLRMADALILGGRLNGMTRAQVVSLLGPDSDSGYFKEWDLVYWLGPERSIISLDSEWLVIRFGPSGTVLEYRIVSD